LKLEVFIQNYILRTFDRRLDYLYLGLTSSSNIYIFNHLLDIDMIYFKLKQCTGLVQIYNEELNTAFRDLLVKFNIPLDILGIVHFDKLISWLSKKKWLLEGIQIKELNGIISIIDSEEHLVIYEHIGSYFTMNRFTLLTERYLEVFLNNDFKDCVDISIDTNDRIYKHSIQGSLLDNILPYKCRDWNLILFQGYDLLKIKELKKPYPDTNINLRIWSEGSCCLNYGTHYKNEIAHMCIVRDNVLTFPKQRSD
jgi:hypothetical protein